MTALAYQNLLLQDEDGQNQQNAPLFSQAPVWDEQRDYFLDKGISAWGEQEVPLYATSHTAMANFYADTILDYWCRLWRQGLMDTERTLYVIELGAGSGMFSYLCLQQLLRRWSDMPFHKLQLRYIISDFVEANLKHCNLHPRLQQYVQAGTVDTLLWDVEARSRWCTQNRNGLLTPAALKNPPAFIANYLFDSLRQDLFRIHYGKIHVASIKHDRATENETNVLNISYQWEKLEAAYFNDPDWNTLLDYYLTWLDSTQLLLPTGALSCIDELIKSTHARALLLVADRGYYGGEEIRNHPPVEFAKHGSYSLPVNFHALQTYLKIKGGEMICQRQRQKGIVVGIACFDNHNSDREFLAECGNRLNGHHPDILFIIKKSIQPVISSLQPEQMLNYLRLSQWDCGFIELFLEPLLNGSWEYSPAERIQWLTALQECWNNYYELHNQPHIVFNSGLLAMRLAGFGLAQECFSHFIDTYDEDSNVIYNLAYCQWQLACSNMALSTLRKQLLFKPDQGDCWDLYKTINRWMEYRHTARFFNENISQDGELKLEPLGHHHLELLLYQYRDPNIAVMARLPKLESLEQAEEWLNETRQLQDQGTFAIIHKDHGFIGIVSLIVTDDKGFFYFWLGTDFQGIGLGVHSSNILFNMVEKHLGIKTIYATAFRDNSRSQRSLRKLGFKQLNFKAAAPEEETVFMRRSDQKLDEPGLWYELNSVLAGIESALVAIKAE